MNNKHTTFTVLETDKKMNIRKTWILLNNKKNKTKLLQLIQDSDFNNIVAVKDVSGNCYFIFEE